MSEQTAWAKLVTTQLATLSRENERLWEAVAEVRDGLADLDFAKTPRRQFEELHGRVDALEATARLGRVLRRGGA